MKFNQRIKKTKWGPPNQKTIMNNISNILPSNLSPDILHSLLLRFQFEEIQYKLEHLDEEFKNICYEDNNLINQNSENRSHFPITVKARDILIQERRQIVDSIEKVFPAFRLPFSMRISSNKTVKRIDLPNFKCISKIIGRKCSNLNNLEQNNRVKISLRSSYLNDIDKSSYLLIIGTQNDDVERCFNQILKLIDYENNSQEILKKNINNIDPNNFSLSFDPNISIPPWTSYQLSNYKLDISTEVNDALKEILEELNNGSKNNKNSLLSSQDLERFEINIFQKDISNVLLEPKPPGIEDN